MLEKKIWNIMTCEKKNRRSKSGSMDFLAFFKPLKTTSSTSLFVKTRTFSFFIDKILYTCRTSILKFWKDSPEFREHSRYLQSIFKVCRKVFLSHFQTWYFFKKAFFTCLGYFQLQKKSFFEKISFLKMAQKTFSTHFWHTL